MRVIAVVPAAGSGIRFGGPVPKQYMDLDGRPVLVHTLERLVKAGVDHIVLAIDPAERDRVSGITHTLNSPVSIVAGGAARQASVLAGVREANRIDSRALVAVHDAVRPCFGSKLWSRLVSAAATTGAAVPLLPPTDTVHRVENGLIVETPRRSDLGMAQTPQVFRMSLLLEVMQRAEARGLIGTDEAGLVAEAGHLVAAVDGDPLNVKLTTKDDLARVIATRHEWEAW